MLHVNRVKTRHQLRQFIRLPWSIYADDSAWIPPLILERKELLSPRNPYFEHARFQSWIAYRKEAPVGRISAQIDQLHLDQHQADEGFFGMLESEDDAETFAALFQTAERWLRDQGMHRVLGPYNLSINQEPGLLVDGFETPPYFLMGHARPYYAMHMEKNGFQKLKDLLAYRVAVDDFTLTPAMQAVTKRAKKRVKIRSLRKTNFDEDLQNIGDIFNDAWSQNWGFIPFTPKEFKQLGKEFKLVLKFEMVKIAEIDGRPAAFMVMVPNINETIRDLNGRLMPFGWLKLLWRLKVKFPQTTRIPFMGVRQQYQDSLMGAAMALMMIQALYPPAIKHRVKDVEMSWILEDNKGTRDIIEGIKGSAYKRYRIYGKNLI